MVDRSLTWTMIAAVGTVVMAIAVIATAIYAIKNWSKSLKKDRQYITAELFKEFNNDIEIKTGIWEFSYNKDTDLNYKSNAIEMILFFAKVGKLLQNEIIVLKDIENYFYNFLFFEERMLNIINNLKNLSPKIPEEYINNFNFLMNKISESANINSYKNVVVNSFEPISFDDFGRSVRIIGNIKSKIKE